MGCLHTKGFLKTEVSTICYFMGVPSVAAGINKGPDTPYLRAFEGSTFLLYELCLCVRAWTFTLASKGYEACHSVISITGIDCTCRFSGRFIRIQNHRIILSLRDCGIQESCNIKGNSNSKLNLPRQVK